MMGAGFRAIVFDVLLWLWSLFCFVVCLPLLAFPLRFVQLAGRIWIRGILFLSRHVVGLTYRVVGKDYISNSPVIYAVKHQSAWETLVLSLLVPSGAYVLKKELLYIPLLGWYFMKTGQIAIDRGAGRKALKSMLARASDAVCRGRSPIIFPEGTRVKPGAHKNYHPGIAALYQHLSLPVVPVAVNSGRYWPRNDWRKWPGEIVIEFLPPIALGLPRTDFMRRLETEIETTSDRLLKL